ncbi:ABC transporter substrate-binding protein [Paenibacillus silvisoli]|uniref:ABC transporter substrate-binding protein n=1 Tax=Paenibacillus silvisoli TaxID=3110539 RepID=UPI0028046661|nr:extracellular solute-binding protein [Paenibacillus silvisoli]
MRFHKPVHGPPGKEGAYFQERFSSIHRRSRIEVTYSTPSWESWFAALQQREHRYDLIYIPGGWIPSLAESGLLADLSEMDAASVALWKGNYPDSVFSLGEYNGRQFGIPVYGAVWSFMYNARLLEAAGYHQPPATWEQLRQCAFRLKELFPEIVPYGINDDSDGHFVDHGYIYLFAGGLAELQERNGTLRFDNAWSQKGMSFIRELIEQGAANVPMNYPSSRILTEFFEGKAAMTVGPSDWVLLQREQFPSFPLGVSLMPHPFGGSPLSYASFGFYCVSSHATNTEEIIPVLNELVTPTNLEEHARVIGMLPVHHGGGKYEADPELSVFCRQVQLSGTFPQVNFSFNEELTREMLACLRLAKSPEDALLTATMCANNKQPASNKED